LAFLWVELGADPVVAADNGRDRAAILHMGQELIPRAHAHPVGVDEVGVGVLAQSGQNMVVAAQLQNIPTHVGHAVAGAGIDGLHSAMNPAEAPPLAIFEAEIGKQLHPHTDAQERCCAIEDGLFHRLDHALTRCQRRLALGEMANARQYNTV